MSRISKEEYLADPCSASSLPFWKTEQFAVPENVSVFRDDEFDKEKCPGTDERYFKLIHDLRSIPRPVLPKGYELTAAGPEELAEHINACYTEERVTAEELAGYAGQETYDAELWIAVRDRATGKIAASGIGAFDARIHGGKAPDISDLDIPASLKQSYLAVLVQIQMPYLTKFLSLDMRPLLGGIACPVLALNGTKDTQVDCRSNLDALRSGLPARPQNRIEAVEGVNHLFQTCSTGASSEYRTIEETIAPSVLETIVRWVSAL